MGEASNLDPFRGRDLGNVKEEPEEAVNLRFLFYRPCPYPAPAKH